MHERARYEIKWTMIGQTIITVALPGFDGLGSSLTPIFFPETEVNYNYLHIVQNNVGS